MSREERRQYQRMMKNMDRGPALPPAARARAERAAARRGRRPGGQEQRGAGRGFWVRAAIAALVVGFLAFSLQWSNGIGASLTWGVGSAAIVLGLFVGFRLLQRRAPQPPAQ